MSISTSYRDRSRSAGFVDLRCFAAEAMDELHMLAADNPENAFLACRTAVWASGAPSSVGVLRIAGRGRVAAMPESEFVMVLAGAVRFTTADGVHDLAVGDGAVLSRRVGFDWQAERETVLAYMRFDDDPQRAPAIVPLSKTPSPTPSAIPSADLLLGPAPVCRTHLDYLVGEGRFKSGTWDSTPCSRLGFRYPHHEIMHILEGHVVLTDEFGHAETFGVGDIILAEFASHCAWHSPDKVVKGFAISRIAPPAI